MIKKAEKKYLNRTIRVENSKKTLPRCLEYFSLNRCAKYDWRHDRIKITQKH